MPRARTKEVDAPPAWIVEGVAVDYHSIIGGPITQRGLVVRAGPSKMGDHWSVWLVGKAGCVCVEACTPAELDISIDEKIIESHAPAGWALSEAYDYGEALLGRGHYSASPVHDVMSEVGGAPLFERVVPESAGALITMGRRYPLLVAEIKRLRLEVERLQKERCHGRAR